MWGYPKTANVTVRMLAVAFLVGATYTPGGHCYVGWVLAGQDGRWMLKLFAGTLLLGGYLFCLRALMRSLHWVGIAPLLLILGSFIWVLSSWRVIDLDDALQRILVIEAVVVIVLGTGVCFSIIRYHLSGQLDSRALN